MDELVSGTNLTVLLTTTDWSHEYPFWLIETPKIYAQNRKDCETCQYIQIIGLVSLDCAPYLHGQRFLRSDQHVQGRPMVDPQQWSADGRLHRGNDAHLHDAIAHKMRGNVGGFAEFGDLYRLLCL